MRARDELAQTGASWDTTKDRSTVPGLTIASALIIVGSIVGAVGYQRQYSNIILALDPGSPPDNAHLVVLLFMAALGGITILAPRWQKVSIGLLIGVVLADTSGIYNDLAATWVYKERPYSGYFLLTLSGLLLIAGIILAAVHVIGGGARKGFGWAAAAIIASSLGLAFLGPNGQPWYGETLNGLGIWSGSLTTASLVLIGLFAATFVYQIAAGRRHDTAIESYAALVVTLLLAPLLVYVFGSRASDSLWAIHQLYPVIATWSILCAGALALLAPTPTGESIVIGWAVGAAASIWIQPPQAVAFRISLVIAIGFLTAILIWRQLPVSESSNRRTWPYNFSSQVPVADDRRMVYKGSFRTRAPRVFLSYRRNDSAGYSGRLCQDLNERFGEKNVFIDVDSIQFGVDFVDAVSQVISKSDVILVLIGRTWLSAADEAGNRRIDNPKDFVRLEIEEALTKGKRLIPVLVGGAEMPSEKDLPEQLIKLSRRNACEITDRHWRRDVGELLDLIEGDNQARPYEGWSEGFDPSW
jgi:TIR domain